jgi:uncharacterized protein (DUF2237 family)
MKDSNNSRKNVLGGDLQSCCFDPLTGYMRDGYCKAVDSDHGTHVICAAVTAEFLDFTRARGNDLSTPNPAFNFPGLKPGDKWCLCVLRWLEAEKAGVAPPVVLTSTDMRALDYTSLEILEHYAVSD